ncbi:MAG: amidohydrolase family protein [Acidobacteria bacterium]|nr:amidohydrolase family protein [Acidobacteriota bacterium]
MNRWIVWVAFACLAFILDSATAQAQATSGGSPDSPADLVLYNGKILTVNAGFAIAEALAVQGGKIALVGASDEVLKMAGAGTLKIDLKGKTVTPGLIDTHNHIDRFTWEEYAGEHPEVFKRYVLDLKQVSTRQQVLELIKETIARHNFKPGEWIWFAQDNFSSPRHANIWFNELTRYELDRVSPQNPIMLPIGSSPDASGVILNSYAIKEAWQKHGAFIEKYGRYWRDPSGQPSGVFEAPASRLIQSEFAPRPDPKELAPYLKKFLERYPALGVTAISTRIGRTYIEGYEILESKGELVLRIGYGQDNGVFTDIHAGFAALDNSIGKGTDQIWVVGVTPQAMDGSGARESSATPRLKQWPMGNFWPTGASYLDPEYLRARGNYYREYMLSMAEHDSRLTNVHVAGDRANSQMLDVMEQVEQMKGPGFIRSQRWAIDHCRMLDPRDIPRIAKLGVMMSCAVGNIESAGDRVAIYGDNVAQNFTAPLKSLIDAGVRVVLGSDSRSSLWEDIGQQITRKDRKGRVWGAHEKVDRETSLRIATRWAAEYLLKEDRIGSLEKGKFADLIVIDRDYMSVPEDDIANIQVLMTVKGGKFTFVNRDTAKEYGLNPPGALISTYAELVPGRGGE